MSVTELPTESGGDIAAVRAFNRFYTRKLGVLDQHFGKSLFSLSEAQRLAFGALADLRSLRRFRIGHCSAPRARNTKR